MSRRLKEATVGSTFHIFKVTPDGPFDADVHDEVPALRKHSFQGEARRTI
jgi:hypothetical protein